MEKLSLNECSKKLLNDTYVIVYAIKNEICLKRDGVIGPQTIYTFLGIDKKGYKQLLDIYLDNPNDNRYWLGCFEKFKNRGIKRILFMSVENNKNLRRTAKMSFPDVVFIDPIADIIPKFYKYCTSKEYSKISQAIYDLYTQDTIIEYKGQLDDFKSKYNAPIYQKLTEKYLSNIETVYKYSKNMRMLLFRYHTNTLLYDKIRLLFNSYKKYINDISEIYDKLSESGCYFGFNSFKKKEWTLMINDLMELYADIEFI